MTEQELIDKIQEYMQKIEESLENFQGGDEPIVYGALCNCTMPWLCHANNYRYWINSTDAYNYKEVLEATMSQFRQFESELDKVRIKMESEDGISQDQ